MKLVIDIPEKTIAHIRSDYGHGYKGLYDEDREIIVNAIYKARPYVKLGAYIDGYLKALEDKEWIPVSERLPEIHQDVLLELRSGEMLTGFKAETEPYFYCHGVDGCYVEPQNVLAWQPLPEPYKGGDV